MSDVATADTPDDNTEARTRLGELVKHRRLELRTSVRAAATTAGIARDTWTGLEEATRRTAQHAYAGIEKALHWAPSSVKTILDGGNPTPTHAESTFNATAGLTATASTTTTGTHPADDALIRVMKSPDLDDQQKAYIVRTLIAEQQRFAEQRVDELIALALAKND